MYTVEMLLEISNMLQLLRYTALKYYGIVFSKKTFVETLLKIINVFSLYYTFNVIYVFRLTLFRFFSVV